MLQYIPEINTCLNFTALILMVSGYYAIRTKKITSHKFLMISAVVASGLFLSGYLYYHFAMEAKKYAGVFPWVYYPMLISHILLAMTIPFQLIYVITMAYKNKLENHKKVAKYTLAIWSYVSLTGVLIYFFIHA